MFGAASAVVPTLSPTAFAQQKSQYGSADEAKAMLMKAVAAVKADKAKALEMFDKGEGGSGLAGSMSRLDPSRFRSSDFTVSNDSFGASILALWRAGFGR